MIRWPRIFYQISTLSICLASVAKINNRVSAVANLLSDFNFNFTSILSENGKKYETIKKCLDYFVLPYSWSWMNLSSVSNWSIRVAARAERGRPTTEKNVLANWRPFFVRTIRYRDTLKINSPWTIALPTDHFSTATKSLDAGTKNMDQEHLREIYLQSPCWKRFGISNIG